jgi:hypothetical protein
MPRNKTMPCAICNEPMWKSSTSKPEGEAAHNACRKARTNQDGTKACIECGKTFKSRDKSLCGGCRHEKAKAKSTGPCQQCDKPATVKGLCITHYSYEHRAKRGRTYKAYAKECDFCRGAFTTTTKSTAYCSLECAQRHRAGWSTSKDIVLYAGPHKTIRPRMVRLVPSDRTLTAGPCRVCGEPFVTLGQDVTCSTTCSKVNKRDARHARAQRRRALKRDAFVSPVFRRKVFESDGYRCHICNKMTNKNAIFPHPKAPTIDHLIPLSKGGTHEPVNCRTAHFMCNSIKSDRLAGDQLILFAM